MILVFAGQGTRVQVPWCWSALNSSRMAARHSGDLLAEVKHVGSGGGRVDNRVCGIRCRDVFGGGTTEALARTSDRGSILRGGDGDRVFEVVGAMLESEAEVGEVDSVDGEEDAGGGVGEGGGAV